MSAQIIQLFDRGARTAPLTAPAAGRTSAVSAAFQALPFVSGPFNEYGWPEKLWCPEAIDKDGTRFENASRFAACTVAALRASTEYQASVGLARLLETIIKQEAIRMARGGKGSRSLDGAALAYFDRLGVYIGRALAGE